MDHTEDLSARVLLKHILTTELPRTPITRSASNAAVNTSATRRSSRLGSKDGGAQTPQDLLRHSLKHKIRESITRKSLPPPKRRTASVVLKKINTPATASVLFDDGDTPRHILRNILRTEPVRTPVVHEKAASDEPQPSSANSSIASKRQSTELSGLDLPDLTISNVISTAKGLSRKRPRRSLNVTAFEKRLLHEEDVEGQTEEASQDNSSLSLSRSSTSLSLKTPYVDVHTEKRGLQRRVSNRRKITEEEFGAAVNRRHMGGASSFMQEERGPSETAYSEGFTLGLSKLSEPDITADILHCNTALYAQPDAMTSNYSIVATQDKPTVMASQLQRQMSEMEEEEPSELRKEKSMYTFPTEEEAVAEPQDEEYISESQETEGGSTTNGQAQDVAVTSKSEEEEDTAVSHTGVRGDTGESEDEENVVEAETREEGATDSQTEEEEGKEDGGVDSESEEDGTTRSQSEEVPPDSQTQEEEEDAVDSQIEDECADDAQHEEEEIQPDSENQEEKDEDDAVDSQSDEKEAAVDSLPEEEDAEYESRKEDPAEVSVSQFKPDDDHDGEEDGEEVEDNGEEVEEVGEEVEDDGEEVEDDGEEVGEDGEEVEDDGEQASEQLEGDVEHISRRAHRSGGGLIVPVAEAEGDLADGPEARLSDGKSEANATFDLQNSSEMGSHESGHLTEFSNHGQRDAAGAEKENSFDPPPVTQDIEDNGQMSDESPEEAAAQEEEWEEEEEIEDVPSKTPAFVRQRRNLLRPDPLASPSVLKNIQASASDSGGLPAPAPKQARKRRTGPSRKREGLPKSYLMSVFKHFAKTKVSADVYPVLQEIMDKFFERLAEDLETYAIHAKRKTIEVEDAELLLRRQGHVSDKVPVEVLIEKYLRMDQRKLLIPIATSGNVVFPKKRR